jgi:hypothetical protein
MQQLDFPRDLDSELPNRHRPRLSRYGQWLQLDAKWWFFGVR